MNNFKILYKILKLLEESMDFETFDKTELHAEALGVSSERWKQLVIMLVDNGYIEGVVISKATNNQLARVKLNNVTITLKGLEYLEENSFIKRAANVINGAINIIN